MYLIYFLLKNGGFLQCHVSFQGCKWTFVTNYLSRDNKTSTYPSSRNFHPPEIDFHLRNKKLSMFFFWSYPSSHNHGSEKWGPPIVVTCQIQPSSTSMIMGETVFFYSKSGTNYYLEPTFWVSNPGSIWASCDHQRSLKNSTTAPFEVLVLYHWNGPWLVELCVCVWRG